MVRAEMLASHFRRGPVQRLGPAVSPVGAFVNQQFRIGQVNVPADGEDQAPSGQPGQFRMDAEPVLGIGAFYPAWNDGWADPQM